MQNKELKFTPHKEEDFGLQLTGQLKNKNKNKNKKIYVKHSALGLPKINHLQL